MNKSTYLKNKKTLKYNQPTWLYIKKSKLIVNCSVRH